MHKIGEIWVDDSGCGVFVGFILLAAVIGIIVLPIVGGIWLYHAGSNLVHYGTIDADTAHMRATATVEARNAESTATALAPVSANPRYYADFIERANISIGNVSNLGHDQNKDAIYFNIDFTNGDDRSHTIDVVFQGRLAKEYEGSLLSPPSPFKRRILLHPGHNTQRIIEPPETPVSISLFGSRFGGMSLDPATINVKIELIDGFPLQDPREVFSKISAELVLVKESTFVIGQTRTVCYLKLNNMDSKSHSFSGYVEFEYSYRELGELKRESGSTFGNSFRMINGTVNPAKISLLESYDGGILPSLPSHLTSITVKRVVLELTDVGTESLHPSVKTKSLSSSGCDFRG